MTGRSSIEQLDPAILSEVHAAIERGQTIDQIVALIQSAGADASRSAVGRYTKNFGEVARQAREVRSVAEAFGKEFGADDGREGRLMIQLVQTLVTRAVMASADQEAFDPKELHYFARSVKDILSASKIDVEREARVREEAARQAREKAADDAEAAGRQAGASEATIDLVKRRILGIN